MRFFGSLVHPCGVSGPCRTKGRCHGSCENFGARRSDRVAEHGDVCRVEHGTLAADLPPPLPPPVYRPPVAVETGGWYLRGDVGIGMQQFLSFDIHQTNVVRAPSGRQLAHRQEGYQERDLRRRRHRLSPGTTGCASTSPANTAARSEFKALGSYHAHFCDGRPLLRPMTIDGHQVGVGVPRQRLSRSRDLVVRDAVHRRRRRRGLPQDRALSAIPTSSPAAAAGRSTRRSTKWNLAWAAACRPRPTR